MKYKNFYYATELLIYLYNNKVTTKKNLTKNLQITLLNLNFSLFKLKTLGYIKNIKTFKNIKITKKGNTLLILISSPEFKNYIKNFKN